MKKILTTVVLLCSMLPAGAMIWHYDNFDARAKECTLVGWEGNQPTSGKLTIPGSYTHTDGITYKVVTIASHALDNLTEVTEITIPASVSDIGKTNTYGIGGVENFENCPRLKKFAVASGNSYFSATNAGMLVGFGSAILYKVPQAKEFADNTITLSGSIEHIAEGAFSDNSTVTALKIPASVTKISSNPGIHRMTNLSQITVPTSNTNCSVDAGALVCQGEIVAYPPARADNKVTLTSKAKRVCRYAFVNTRYLNAITLPSTVTEIEESAFEGSSVKSVEIPSAVKSIGARAFAGSGLTSVTLPASCTFGEELLMGCGSLTSINVKGKDAVISRRFAKDCGNLEKVTFGGAPKELGGSSFENCVKLTQYKFYAETDYSFYADNKDYSSGNFVNTGFGTVTFESGTLSAGWQIHSLFRGCRNLKSIDMSKIKTGDNQLSIGSDFATSCPNLTEIRLPDGTDFGTIPIENADANIGPGTPLEKLVLGIFTVTSKNAVIQYDGGTHSPKVFVKTTDSGVSPDKDRCQLNRLFRNDGNAQVSPVFICEALTPMPNYAMAGASYYIPGKSSGNYSAVTEAGSKMTEAFSIEVVNNAGIIEMNIRPNTPDVTVDYVYINDQFGAKPMDDGQLNLGYVYGDVKTIRVDFSVFGEKMTTLYPRGLFDGSGADLIESDIDRSDIMVNGTVAEITGMGESPVYTLISAGGAVVRTGTGSSVSLSGITPGLYLLNAAGSGSSVSRKIIVR